METTYTIEFMRLAEPPLTPIKHPSAFHIAYYCRGMSVLLPPVRDSLPRRRSILVSHLTLEFASSSFPPNQYLSGLP
jgi:hypothetical protein